MMKNFRFTFLFAALLAFASFTACGNHSHSDATSETTDDAKQGKEYTSAYICPMYCTGSGSAEPGKCPVCGMDYVANEKQASPEHEGHDHDHEEGHEGHQH